MAVKQKIIPHLWFDNNAEEAVNFYLTLFDDSKITHVSRYGDAGPGPKGMVMSIGFELNGQRFAGLNGGPIFKFNEAVSFLIWCDTQEEIDSLWNRLVDGGTPQQCGWVKDRFGLVWQVNWAGLPGVLGSSDAAASTRAMQAMMQMKKIGIQKLKDAHAGN